MKIQTEEPKTRIFNIMQYEKNPRTGEDLHFTEKNITEALAHRGIKQWAYIRHDEDVYTDEDEKRCEERLEGDYKRLVDEAYNCDLQGGMPPSWEEYLKREKWVHAGEKKPAHWHIVGQLGYAVGLSVLSKWFSVPAQYIEMPKGKGAFLDCVGYLTHEDEKQQAAGKHLYPDDAICANFDWRGELTHRAEVRARYHRDELTERDELRMDVLLNGKTLAQCAADDPIGFAADMPRLEKLRARYLATLPMPPVRINYYIEGRGGVGKSTLARLLAKALFPGLTDESCYFEVGGSGVAFDGYDGQPVMIWHDRRAPSLLKEFGGRGNVFTIFDTHPAAIKQNVKYASASLVNAVNIIEGIEPYQEFLNELAGEYKGRDGEQYLAEDKGQAYRRFPLIICLHESDFDLLVNKGFALGTYEFDQYIGYKKITGNFGRVMARLNGAAREKVIETMTAPIVDEHRKLESAATTKCDDADALPAEFADYGRAEPMRPRNGNYYDRQLCYDVADDTGAGDERGEQSEASAADGEERREATRSGEAASGASRATKPDASEAE